MLFLRKLFYFLYYSQSKFIFLDSFLLCFIAAAVWAYLDFQDQKNKFVLILFNDLVRLVIIGGEPC
jgi:dolichyl-phosphate-mannose--protein O-mannosyl transferase